MSLDDRLGDIIDVNYYGFDNIRQEVINDSKQAILADLLEIIGEDEPFYPKGGGMVIGENTVRSFKNDLRQELREKIKAYCS